MAGRDVSGALVAAAASAHVDRVLIAEMDLALGCSESWSRQTVEPSRVVRVVAIRDVKVLLYIVVH